LTAPDLKRAGLIAITKITQIDDLGHFKGVPAIKKVNELVFRLSGLGEMLERARKAVFKRLQNKVGKDSNPLSMTERFGSDCSFLHALGVGKFCL